VKRELLTAIGIVVALGGFTMIFWPELGRALASSRGMVVAVGVLAAIQGYRIARDRRRTALEVAETGDPETEQDLPVPGEDFDDLVEYMQNMGGPRPGTSRHRRRRRDSFVRSRRRLKGRLEDAAVATITRKYGCTDAEALESLERGTWTDDPFAAAFFTGSLDGVGLVDRLRLRFALGGRFERRAVRAARAIADLSDRDRVAGSPSDPGPVTGGVGET